MRAVRCNGSGDENVLSWTEVDDPTPGPDDVLVEVAASALNRADLMQRQGFYPPPPGVTDILGLECSGRIVAVGDDVPDHQVGSEVCCLLAGGGQAEVAVVPAGQAMPVPGGVDLVTAAALPEVACTVWSNLVMRAQLQGRETLLVQGGSSGIGTMAIQVGKALGATVVATVGSDAKAKACRGLGADFTINYNDADFVEATRDATGGRGADVILDIVGAKYLARNIDVLATNGRLVIIGLQGGISAELNLSALLTKRGAIHATSLRVRPLDEKAAICAAVVRDLWPLVAAGTVRPIVDRTIAMNQVAEAHRLVESSSHIGKVVLTPP